MATNKNQTDTTADETQAELQIVPVSDFWPEVVRSKTGNNNCRCIERWAEADTATTLAYVTGTCDRHTKGEFAQGHDAKYKGSLISAHRMGRDVAIFVADGSRMAVGSALDWAALRNWETFLLDGKENAKAIAKLQGKVEAPAEA